MSERIQTEPFTAEDTAAMLRSPTALDDKYTRGVVGFVTGSHDYPGAAVLGVTAALHTGVGMVRFRGEQDVATLVLQRRPEVVCVPGRVDAWVLGSGVDAASRSWHLEVLMREALASGVPCVLDAGALDLVTAVSGWAVITPHARELSRMFAGVGRDISVEQIRDEPERWASEAAATWSVTVLLKGSRTLVASPSSPRVREPVAGSAWLATAGTGDVLAGALGAVLATQAAWQSQADSHARARTAADTDDRDRAVAAAATLHALASKSLPGPFTALQLAEALGNERSLARGGRFEESS